MTASSSQFARTFPSSIYLNREFHFRFERPSFRDVRVLLSLAALLCLLVCVPVRQHRSLDERAMLSAMFAAGGMPLLYVPPERCAGPPEPNRFEQAELRTVLQNQR